MKKFIIALLLLCTPALAETRMLKLGKVYEGGVIEKTDESVKIDFYEAEVAFYMDEVKFIDGERLIIKKV